jgi:hypothetical protein
MVAAMSAIMTLLEFLGEDASAHLDYLEDKPPFGDATVWAYKFPAAPEARELCVNGCDCGSSGCVEARSWIWDGRRWHVRRNHARGQRDYFGWVLSVLPNVEPCGSRSFRVRPDGLVEAS